MPEKEEYIRIMVA